MYRNHAPWSAAISPCVSDGIRCVGAPSSLSGLVAFRFSTKSVHSKLVWDGAHYLSYALAHSTLYWCLSLGQSTVLGRVAAVPAQAPGASAHPCAHPPARARTIASRDSTSGLASSTHVHERARIVQWRTASHGTAQPPLHARILISAACRGLTSCSRGRAAPATRACPRPCRSCRPWPCP